MEANRTLTSEAPSHPHYLQQEIYDAVRAATDGDDLASVTRTIQTVIDAVVQVMTKDIILDKAVDVLVEIGIPRDEAIDHVYESGRYDSLCDSVNEALCGNDAAVVSAAITSSFVSALHRFAIEMAPRVRPGCPIIKA